MKTEQEVEYLTMSKNDAKEVLDRHLRCTNNKHCSHDCQSCRYYVSIDEFDFAKRLLMGEFDLNRGERMKQGYQPIGYVENPMPPKGGPAYVPGKNKTEQEVRAAVDREIGGSVLIYGRYGHPEDLSEVATLDIQDLAVVIGKALGVIE